MPLYEFYCSACGLTFDELLPLPRLQQPVLCPQCDREATRKTTAANFTIGGFNAKNGYSK